MFNITKISPEYLALKVNEGDPFSLTIDFGTDVSGWGTWNTKYEHANGTVYTRTVDTTNAATGLVVISEAGDFTDNFTPHEVHYWELIASGEAVLYRGHFIVLDRIYNFT